MLPRTHLSTSSGVASLFTLITPHGRVEELRRDGRVFRPQHLGRCTQQGLGAISIDSLIEDSSEVANDHAIRLDQVMRSREHEEVPDCNPRLLSMNMPKVLLQPRIIKMG